MIFTETRLKGAYIIDLDLKEDSRGFFARTFCAQEFARHSLESELVQCSISFNIKRGTIRGLHYQLPPSEEVKLVRCVSGAILDVIVDLRPDSPTYLQHIAVELTARNRRTLYVPRLFAHGFQTLEDSTEVFYQMTEYFVPEKATGLRYDDPKLGISWPLPVSCVSSKDQLWPLME